MPRVGVGHRPGVTLNIWLVSPAWGRFAVTQLVLAQRRWLCDTLSSRGWTVNSVIVADDDNLDIAAEYGFATVEKDNSDLGMKFNAGFVYAAEQGADVFVFIGSDDWVHPAAFDALETVDLNEAIDELSPTADSPVVVWRKGPKLLGQRSITLVDLPRGAARRCYTKGRYGCIPWFIPRSALEPCGFAPIAPGHQRGMEGLLVRGIKHQRSNWIFQEADPLWCVDFKSDSNITSYRSVAGTLGITSIDEDPWGFLGCFYPAELVAQARRLSQDMREQVAA